MPAPYSSALRSLALGLLCGFLGGCGGGTKPGSADDIQAKIERIQGLRDPKALKDARDQIYAIGPAALPPLRDSILSIYDHSQVQLIAVASCFPEGGPILTMVLRRKDPSRRRQALYGISLMSRPPDVGGVLPLTKSPAASDREWALYALDENNDPSARSS